MNATKAADRRPITFSRRASLLYAGALVFSAAGWLLDPRPAWAQTGRNQSFALDIHDGHVSADKKTIRVTEGDRGELKWTADETVALHLHGYDLRLDLKGGASGSMTFKAHTAGRFPIGIHGATGHGHGALLYLEVHPR
ncbi:MAG: hypothetical protein QGF38_14640 [Rhodospirillales bacterium]|jgi:FtsP/CotA-like multicopper oxidase with cupredoxin domain|nr:hypothetical protein [Rhodospirillales bacterium]